MGGITGEDMNLGGSDALGNLGDEDPVADAGDLDDMSDLDDIDVNEPAAAGPEDEPLGRAPVEV